MDVRDGDMGEEEVSGIGVNERGRERRERRESVRGRCDRDIREIEYSREEEEERMGEGLIIRV